MRIRVTGLVSTLAVLLAATPALADRDHTGDRGGRHERREYPTDPPPAARAERVRPRRGYAWVGGTYVWRNGAYAWTAGHWERAQPGKRWRDGHWDQQGDRYVWTDGTWEEAFPTEAPPAAPAETAQRQRGYTWIAGYYTWENGGYVWVAGHLEARQKGKHFQAGHWDQQGDRYVWTEGTWVDNPQDPNLAPPDPVQEPQAQKQRRGYVWINGNYEWQDGQWVWVGGHWERSQNGKHWRDTKWDQDGDHWVKRQGGWDQDDQGNQGNQN
jgi:hypothetical protein